MNQQIFKPLFAIFAFITSCGFLHAQDTVDVALSFDASERSLLPSVQQQYRNYKIVSLESAALASQVASGAHAAFRFDLGAGKQWILELERSTLASPTYELVALTPDGEKRIPSSADFLYKGKVNCGGAVRLAIKDGFIWGSVRVEMEEYFIEPLDRFTGKKSKDLFLLYQRREDVSGLTITCGYRNEVASVANAKKASPFDRVSTLGEGECLQLPFVPTADYSIYQKFGGDIKAVEAALLAIMNLAEGAFTTLNFGVDGSSDLGKDAIHLEVKKIVVATCAPCDFITKTENAATVAGNLSQWVQENEKNSNGTIYQIWTTRDLFQSSSGGIVGTIYGNFQCAFSSGEILKYASDDPAFLRVLVAHETGHLLGCPHDNDMKSSVRNYIMYSSAGGGHTRFSTLADFGSGTYSSHLQIRNWIKTLASCLQKCSPPPCEGVTGVEVKYFDTPDSVEIVWKGLGHFVTRYKQKDEANFDPSHTKTIANNKIILKGLQPCVTYSFEVEPLCSSGEKGKAFHVIFSASSFTYTVSIKNKRGELHDLQLDMNCKNCSADDYIVTIDHKPYQVTGNFSANTLLVKDIFSDGAVRRVEVRKTSGDACKVFIAYKAPYYRANSTKILAADFNECRLPDGWKDSLLAKAVLTAPNSRWNVGERNSFSPRTARGNFDTTCMLYYSRIDVSGPHSGALSLTSPVVDLTPYKDVKLHFDYLFRAFLQPAVPIIPSFSVEVFDGSNWIRIFERKAESISSSNSILTSNIWDSIPTRLFIDLVPYKNKAFQVRFIADDGSLAASRSWQLFVALDNIVIDGYKDHGNKETNEWRLFPNPALKEIFVQLDPQWMNLSHTYRLLDANGRLIRKDSLIGHRISLEGLSTGVYFVQLFNQDSPIGTKKLIKL